MENYYITKNAFKGLIYNTQELVKYSVKQLANELLDSHEGDALRYLLSDTDIKFLYLTRIIVKSLCEGVYPERKSHENSNYGIYLIDVKSAPKYHKDLTCQSLSNNFINFLIPPEIIDRGDDEVAKARKFANENKLLALHNEPAFLARLFIEFRLKSMPTKVYFDNSGTYKFSSLPLAEMIDQINIKIKEATSFINNNENAKRKKYMPKSLINKGVHSDDVIEWHTIIKPALVNAIFEYTLKSNGYENMSLPVSFLKSFGFEACRVCMPDKKAHL